MVGAPDCFKYLIRKSSSLVLKSSKMNLKQDRASNLKYYLAGL